MSERCGDQGSTFFCKRMSEYQKAIRDGNLSFSEQCDEDGYGGYGYCAADKNSIEVGNGFGKTARVVFDFCPFCGTSRKEGE